MKRLGTLDLRIGWALGLGVFLAGPVVGAEAPARTALDDYINKPDSSYAWKLVRTIPGDGYTGYVIDVTSQTWRSTRDIDRPVWKHWVTLVKPKKVAGDGALLMIGGGNNKSDAPDKVNGMLAALATSTRSVVVELRMVPNQPIVFVGHSDKPRSEDDFVALTWIKFMDTGDPTWLARFPMTKSAVRAMDTVQAFLSSEEGGKLEIKRFVVAGGSKRGWTTWMTGAADDRVVGIVPIVIDVLNVRVSMQHHHAAYGFWAPAVGDYVHHKVTDRMDSSEYTRLLELVDPYSYRHRLTMPKFVLNSAGDQFFLPDSSQFYYDDLVGEKYLRYVPNSDHSLSGTDAVESLGAFYHSILTNGKRPKYTWKKLKNGAIRVRTADRPSQVLLWQATNPDARDFRLEAIGKAYTSSELKGSSTGSYLARVEKPAKGWTAFFVELTYPSDGPYPFKFTTEVSVVPDVLPFKK